MKKLKETRDSTCIYQNELDKTCFLHDMAYGDFKDLNRRTAADKVLRDKAFNIAKNAKCGGYQRELASVVYYFLDKKTSGLTVENEIISNKTLAEEFHNSIIKNFEKRKVHSSFIDSIWGKDLVDMPLMINLIKDLDIYYVLLIFIANINGLFL